MNAAARNLTHECGEGVSFKEIGVRKWTVSIDGKDERQITQDEKGFIAWIGRQSRHWSFSRAVDACAEHARYHRANAERANKAREASIASLMSMTPAQIERAVAHLETERDLLDYADSEIDIVSRKASIDRQIALIRSAVAA